MQVRKTGVLLLLAEDLRAISNCRDLPNPASLLAGVYSICRKSRFSRLFGTLLKSFYDISLDFCAKRLR